MIDVWAEAHDSGRSKGGNLNEDEKDEIWEWLKTRQSPLTLKEAREKANGSGH
jgi:hypothetical protein